MIILHQQDGKHGPSRLAETLTQRHKLSSSSAGGGEDMPSRASSHVGNPEVIEGTETRTRDWHGAITGTRGSQGPALVGHKGSHKDHVAFLLRTVNLRTVLRFKELMTFERNVWDPMHDALDAAPTPRKQNLTNTVPLRSPLKPCAHCKMDLSLGLMTGTFLFCFPFCFLMEQHRKLNQVLLMFEEESLPSLH